jgi:hypothetical protein
LAHRSTVEQFYFPHTRRSRRHRMHLEPNNNLPLLHKDYWVNKRYLAYNQHYRCLGHILYRYPTHKVHTQYIEYYKQHDS